MSQNRRTLHLVERALVVNGVLQDDFLEPEWLDRELNDPEAVD